MIQPAYYFNGFDLQTGMKVIADHPDPEYEYVLYLGSDRLGPQPYLPISTEEPPSMVFPEPDGVHTNPRILEGRLVKTNPIPELGRLPLMITSAEGGVADGTKLVRYNARQLHTANRTIQLECDSASNPNNHIDVRVEARWLRAGRYSVLSHHDVVHELHPGELLYVPPVPKKKATETMCSR